MEHRSLPQYIRVATQLASKISRHEINEGQKLPGLSILSSSYSVSPETARKAITLLEDMGIVHIKENSGTIVLSAQKAQDYLETITVRQKQLDLSNELRSLYKEYQALGKQMIDISSQLVSASANPIPSEQALPNYEVVVPENSDKIGLSIGELRFWQSTGATIVAIKRGQNIMISPGPYTDIRAGDTIVYVGAPSCKQTVEVLLTGKGGRTLYSIRDQITQAIHASELRIIAKALNAEVGELTNFEPLTKGMTNRSFLFTCKNQKYILRIPGEGTDHLINRKEEGKVYEMIHGYGLCDDAVYLNPTNGLKVTKFLNHVHNCDPYDLDDVNKAMKFLRNFHNLKLKVEHHFRIIDKIEFYESLWEDSPSVYPDYYETKKNILSLKPYILKHRGEMYLTHIDAVPDNFLFHEEDGKERLQLTDWEYAGMQDPHVDIAMFCIYSGYTQEQVDQLIDIYFENQCDETTRTKIYCYIASCGLLWSNWCEYKRLLGVEFGDYAKSQYQYAKDYYLLATKRMEK